MELSVISIEGGGYLVREGELQGYGDFYLSGVKISNEMKRNGFSFTDDDNLSFKTLSKEISHYQKKEEILSKDDYDKKPQYYDECSSEEAVLRAIANRKELKGFEVIYKDLKPEAVKLKIVGMTKNTNSKFITCTVCGRYSKAPVLFTVSGSKIAMDEYIKLSEEYKEEARFQEPDRSYLRFVQVNGKYIFHEGKPFSDYHYRSSFQELKEAVEEEGFIRNAVRERVEGSIFTESPTLPKLTNILSVLRLARDCKTKKSTNEVLVNMIENLNNHCTKLK